MAYEDQTKEAILQRMLYASRSDVDKREGAITWDALSPASIEFALAYIELNNVLTYGFAGPDMPREYLILRCAEHGVTPPKPAVKAIGQVTFTGTNGAVIPQGTEVSTGGESPIVFVTTAAGTIASGTVTVAAEAKVGGVDGNVAAGAITLVLGNLTGVTSVTNAADFDGGADEESTASLLQRYLEAVQKPSTSGNANDYKKWAKDIAGISDAKVYPVWNGPGTVKVVIIDEDKTAPIPEKVTEVADYIESVRPIGPTVTVEAAPEVAVNVSVTLILADGAALPEAETQITEGVTDYLKSLAYVDPIVRYSQIANIVLGAEAVVDYSNLTVNGSAANITVADGSVAVIGTVTVS